MPDRLGESIISLAPSAADESVSAFRQSMELEKLREENARLRRERDQLRGTVDAFREQSSKESAEAIVEDVVRGIVDHIAESGQVAILRRANEELKEKYDAMAREVLVLENLVGKLQSNAAEASAASNAAVEEEVIDIILDDDDSSSIASFTLKADVFEQGNGESADYPKTLTPGSQTAWGRFKSGSGEGSASPLRLAPRRVREAAQRCCSKSTCLQLRTLTERRCSTALMTVCWCLVPILMERMLSIKCCCRVVMTP